MRGRGYQIRRWVGEEVPSLISLMVSVDVKHHVYLLSRRRGEPVWPSGKALAEGPRLDSLIKPVFGVWGAL